MVSGPLSGVRAWLAQRLSALGMLALLVYLAWQLAVQSPTGYEAWRDWVGRPGPASGVALLFALLLLHAWVGVRDVILDYAARPVARLGLLALLALWLLGLGLWLALVLAGAVR